jgi:putative membrane protein (TIGR04086 family)
MTMMKKISGRVPSLWKSVGAGLTLGAAWIVVSAVIIAKLVDGQVLPMENVGYGSMAAVLSAVFVGASMAGRRAGHMVVQTACLSGVAYFVSLLLVNVLFFGADFTGVGITLLLTVLATGLALMTAGKGSGKSVRRRYKIPKG